MNFNKYRIDYVFFTTNIKAKSYEVEDVFYSDHFPIIADI